MGGSHCSPDSTTPLPQIGVTPQLTMMLLLVLHLGVVVPGATLSETVMVRVTGPLVAGQVKVADAEPGVLKDPAVAVHA